MHQERKELAFGVRKEAIYVILNDVRLPCLNENKTADNINTNTSHKKIVKSGLNYWMSPASLKCCQMFPKSSPPHPIPSTPHLPRKEEKERFFLSPLSVALSHLLVTFCCWCPLWLWCLSGRSVDRAASYSSSREDWVWAWRSPLQAEAANGGQG